MKNTRSPRERLRVLRAGRVSQLLDPTPADGLPPTDPPRLILNGKPVATGGAFDAVLERAHHDAVTRALSSSAAKSGSKDPKLRPPVTPGGGIGAAKASAQTIGSAFGAKGNATFAAASLLAASSLALDIALRRELETAGRTVPQNLVDLSHLLSIPSNDNSDNRTDDVHFGSPELPPIASAPFPADPPQIDSWLSGRDPDDPSLRDLNKILPFPGTPLELPKNVPEDPEQFNRPQIETFPVTEITWRDLVLYHKSSPETEQDTHESMEMLRDELQKLGGDVVTPEEIGMRSKEVYIPRIVDGVVMRRGYNFADFGIFLVDDHGKPRIAIGNTIDTLADGITPNWRERRAASSIDRNWAENPSSILEILLIPKSRGMTREAWRELARPIIAAAARRIIDRLARK